MRRLLAATALVLALPSVAAAKEVQSLEVCGQGGECHAVHGRASLASYERGLSDAPPPESAGAFLRIRLTIGGDEMPRPVVDTIQWLPATGLLRSAGDDGTIFWLATGERTAAVLHRTARGLTLFPASTLGPLGRERPVRVDEVVLPPSDSGDDGGSQAWMLSLLALVPAGLVFVMRRRGRWN
jgi:hypothetical protein